MGAEGREPRGGGGRAGEGVGRRSHRGGPGGGQVSGPPAGGTPPGFALPPYPLDSLLPGLPPHPTPTRTQPSPVHLRPGPWGSRSGVRGRQLSGRSSRSDPELLVGPSPQGPAEKAGLEVCRPSWRPGGRAPALGCPVGTQAQEARGTLLPASQDRPFVGEAELAA